MTYIVDFELNCDSRSTPIRTGMIFFFRTHGVRSGVHFLSVQFETRPWSQTKPNQTKQILLQLVPAQLTSNRMTETYVNVEIEEPATKSTMESTIRRDNKLHTLCIRFRSFCSEINRKAINRIFFLYIYIYTHHVILYGSFPRNTTTNQLHIYM
jgi:hypothetical protein